MGLSHGIQKYRETAKSTAKKSEPAKKTPEKSVSASKSTDRPGAKGSEKETDRKAADKKKGTATGKDVVPTAKAANSESKTATGTKSPAKTTPYAKTPAANAAAAKSASAKGAKSDQISNVVKPQRGSSIANIDEASEIIESSTEMRLEEEELSGLSQEALSVEGEDFTPEEEELAKELQAEMAQETTTTNALVKEDFTPVNSTRDRLVVEYAPLIKYIAQKIAARLPTNIELDDLISSGVIGLMDAIEKYDAGRDNKFKTYAEFRIRGAILDELRAQDWVPRSVREKAKVLERCYQRIEQQKGRQATDEEVCAELNISATEYHEMLSQVRSVSLLSFDDVNNFSKSDKRSLHGFTDSNNYKSPTPYSEVNTAVLRKMIADAIGDLPEKQRLVLSLYYYEDLNLKEIGRVLDVTESRVSQLHTQAIIRLKTKLRGHWDEFLTLMGA